MQSSCVGTRKAARQIIIYTTQRIQHNGTTLIRSINSFQMTPRSLLFALSTNGMNTFGHMSSSHSVWPVLLSIYNLPPWLCNKRKYMMMSSLISGPVQPQIDIDVFWDLLWMMSKYFGQKVLMPAMGTRGNPSDYVACCSARLLIYRVAVPCPDSVKGKKIALIAQMTWRQFCWTTQRNRCMCVIGVSFQSPMRTKTCNVNLTAQGR
jgi:hypothetical protein